MKQTGWRRSSVVVLVKAVLVVLVVLGALLLAGLGLWLSRERIVDDIFAGFEGRTELDLVAELAIPLPVRVIVEALGLDDANGLLRFSPSGRPICLAIKPAKMSPKLPVGTPPGRKGGPFCPTLLGWSDRRYAPG